MKLGMQTLYEYDKMQENIKLAKELNMQFIELNLDYAYCREALENVEKLKKLMSDNELELTIHFFQDADFGYIDNITKGYIELFKKYVDLAKKCDAKLINVVLNPGKYALVNGRKKYFYEKEEKLYQERLMQNIKTLKEICDKKEIKLALINKEVPDFMRGLYRSLFEEGYSFSYDVGIDYANEKKMAKVLKHYQLDVVCYHIHDATTQVDHLSLGEGEMNLQLAKSLIEDQYTVIDIRDSWDLVRSIKKWNTLE